jgi:hypothetical protein
LSFEIGTLNSPGTLVLALPSDFGLAFGLRVAPLRHVVILRAQNGQAVEILFLDQRLDVGDVLRRESGASSITTRPPGSSMYRVFCGSSGRQSDGWIV